MTYREFSRRVSLRTRNAEFESLADLNLVGGYFPLQNFPLQNEVNRASLQAAYQVWLAKQHQAPEWPDPQPGPG